MALAPVFAAAMERLGPWDAARRVAVAVSGGADSLALLLLAQHWGDPVAFIVDHGVRPESTMEAESTRSALQARGIPARILRLDGLTSGPGLSNRARSARYAALTTACRDAGLVDLLLGHHAGDQAETVLMRQRRGSGPAGLAGMAALVEADDLRLLRPLLDVDPAALRALVATAGLVPAEDPTNTDERTTRARLRREIGTQRADLLAIARDAGRVRAATEAASAAELARRVSLYAEGYAVLSPGPVGADAFAALLRSLSGRRYPVNASALAAAPRGATLAGVRMLPAGRTGDGWLLTREVSQCAPPRTATPGAVWDGRFRVQAAATGREIGALRADASLVRHRSSLPSAVLQSMPALRYNGVLSAVPQLSYPLPSMVADRAVVRNACLPAAGAPFLAS